MPLVPFIQENWVLVLLLVIVLFAILIYEIRTHGSSGQLVSNITASQLVNDGAIIVDTRARDEFKKGHIAGARSAPAEKFAEFLKKHQQKKETMFVLYCTNGANAKVQAQQMHAQGFPNIAILKAGIDGWRQDNLPTVS